jgi:hypothetical protein
VPGGQLQVLEGAFLDDSIEFCSCVDESIVFSVFTANMGENDKLESASGCYVIFILMENLFSRIIKSHQSTSCLLGCYHLHIGSRKLNNIQIVSKIHTSHFTFHISHFSNSIIANEAICQSPSHIHPSSPISHLLPVTPVLTPPLLPVLPPSAAEPHLPIAISAPTHPKVL